MAHTGLIKSPVNPKIYPSIKAESYQYLLHSTVLPTKLRNRHEESGTWEMPGVTGPTRKLVLLKDDEEIAAMKSPKANIIITLSNFLPHLKHPQPAQQRNPCTNLDVQNPSLSPPLRDLSFILIFTPQYPLPPQYPLSAYASTSRPPNQKSYTVTFLQKECSTEECSR
ncbi:hypothetical protein DSL72_003914 [Monilinia vaccinii-corymbosi]|uniref:Uncharacterized protein n=1 Tax=Monilinia vaccinii-corymbosi TaxID=61207 RepID=A0A8A3NZ59_9HELO|nr:hypothetical protein DSL72_003914 [Monilinia vaccinii-corymbosi]